MPGKEVKSWKRKNERQSVNAKKEQPLPSSSLKKRAKINSDQTAIHLDDLSLLEVKRQLTIFDLVYLEAVNRRFAEKLKDQGREVKMILRSLRNGDYGIDMRSQRNAKGQKRRQVLHRIAKDELKAFFKSLFLRMKRLHSLLIADETLVAGYRSVISALKVHPIKIRSLYLKEESKLRNKAKWELLNLCAAHLRELVVFQPRAEGSTNSAAQLQSFGQCTRLRRLHISGRCLPPSSFDCVHQLKHLHRLELSGSPLEDGNAFPLAGDLEENEQLRHLTVSETWLTSAAASSNFALINRLQSFGLASDMNDDDLGDYTTNSLPDMHTALTDIVAMMASGSHLMVTLAPYRQMNLFPDGNAQTAEAIVNDFLAFWLRLSGDGGGKEIVVKFRSRQLKQLIGHLLSSVDDDQTPLEMNESYPDEWKIEKSAHGKQRYLIAHENRRMVLCSWQK